MNMRNYCLSNEPITDANYSSLITYKSDVKFIANLGVFDVLVKLHSSLYIIM